MTNKVSELYSNSHMVVQIKGNLIEMALSGAYSFEDLTNCNYLIDRFDNKFVKNEGRFWNVTREFSWFLEKNKLLKRTNELVSKQISTSRM